MSHDKTSYITAVGGGYVYRLETVWEIFEQYFREDRPYRIFAQIDRIEDHAHIPSLQIGQSWCGLWFLTDVEDAIAFQLLLRSVARERKLPVRFVVRIAQLEL